MMEFLSSGKSADHFRGLSKSAPEQAVNAGPADANSIEKQNAFLIVMRRKGENRGLPRIEDATPAPGRNRTLTVRPTASDSDRESATSGVASFHRG